MTKFYEVVDANPTTVVVRCLDRRFRKAHRGFIREELCLQPEDYWPLKPAGGAAILAKPTQMHAEFSALIADIDLAVKHSDIARIILISHQDCKKMERFLNQSQPHAEKECLHAGIRLMEYKYPNIEVSAYYAQFNEDRTLIFFEAVKASSLQKTDQQLVIA